MEAQVKQTGFHPLDRRVIDRASEPQVVEDYNDEEVWNRSS
jgi:hypothetical protein